jgi:hypothetical protein
MRTLIVLSYTVMIAAMALTLALGGGIATAKISPPSCETQGGGTPPGQQPTCKGGGLEQQPAENPAGHAPPGQQP